MATVTNGVAQHFNVRLSKSGFCEEKISAFKRDFMDRSKKKNLGSHWQASKLSLSVQRLFNNLSHCKLLKLLFESLSMAERECTCDCVKIVANSGFFVIWSYFKWPNPQVPIRAECDYFHNKLHLSIRNLQRCHLYHLHMNMIASACRMNSIYDPLFI